MPTNPFTGSRIASLTQRVQANTKSQIIKLTTELTAQNQRAIAGALGGEAPTTRFVDGVVGKPLGDVKPDGFTLTEFHLIGHVIDEIIKALFAASPYGPEEGGHYRDDHLLFVNGQRRDATAEGEVVAIKPTDEVVIINVRPYARKIEGGRGRRTRGKMTSRRPGLSVQAPNGVYEITGRQMAARFGNMAKIRFVYRSVIGGGMASSSASPRTRNASPNRFPALEITVRI